MLAVLCMQVKKMRGELLKISDDETNRSVVLLIIIVIIIITNKHVFLINCNINISPLHSN